MIFSISSFGRVFPFVILTSPPTITVFVVANVIAHVIGWVVVAPVLDILIYAEPANKVFAQGVFAAISNTITGVIVGGLLILAYTKTIAKKGSLDQE